MIAADPYQGGATWAVLQYVLGLRELGWDVYHIEPVPAEKWQFTSGRPETSANVRYWKDVVNRFDLVGHSALLDGGTRTAIGLGREELAALANRADLLLNISGMLQEAEFFTTVPVRAYLDLDPAFVQIWHAQGIDMRFAGHTHFVTIGLAIGTASCAVPTAGLNWIKTLQPLVLREWPVSKPSAQKTLTTIGNWRGYGAVHYEGRFFGLKAHSVRELIELPRRCPVPVRVAFGIHPDEARDLRLLGEHGWEVIEPIEIASSPDAYRAFIQNSWAELGVAKQGYATSRCGWFSDRSICYLASGRPVLAQETGWSDYLPQGRGLFAFRSLDDILRSVELLERDYASHSAAARRIAEGLFDSNKVLPALLKSLGL